MHRRIFVFLSYILIAQSANATITAAQEKTALGEIDSICGDTWCEGDFGFDFDMLKCETASQSCTLSFRMTEYLDETNPRGPMAATNDKYDHAFKDSSLTRIYDVECRIKSISEYSDLMDGSFLNSDFYEKLTDCVWDLEKFIRAPSNH